MKTLILAVSLLAALALAGVHPATAETPYLPYTLSITPELKKAFRDTDSIEVRAIIGTAPRFEVGGTYRIVGVCRQRTVRDGLLYVGNTAAPGSMAIVPLAGSSLYKPCPNGLTDFDTTFTLLRPGVLHVTIYDQENKNQQDNAYAGLSLGEVTASR